MQTEPMKSLEEVYLEAPDPFAYSSLWQLPPDSVYASSVRTGAAFAQLYKTSSNKFLTVPLRVRAKNGESSLLKLSLVSPFFNALRIETADSASPPHPLVLPVPKALECMPALSVKTTFTAGPRRPWHCAAIVGRYSLAVYLLSHADFRAPLLPFVHRVHQVDRDAGRTGRGKKGRAKGWRDKRVKRLVGNEGGPWDIGENKILEKDDVCVLPVLDYEEDRDMAILDMDFDATSPTVRFALLLAEESKKSTVLSIFTLTADGASLRPQREGEGAGESKIERERERGKYKGDGDNVEGDDGEGASASTNRWTWHRVTFDLAGALDGWATVGRNDRDKQGLDEPLICDGNFEGVKRLKSEFLNCVKFNPVDPQEILVAGRLVWSFTLRDAEGWERRGGFLKCVYPSTLGLFENVDAHGTNRRTYHNLSRRGPLLGGEVLDDSLQNECDFGFSALAFHPHDSRFLFAVSKNTHSLILMDLSLSPAHIASLPFAPDFQNSNIFHDLAAFAENGNLVLIGAPPTSFSLRLSADFLLCRLPLSCFTRRTSFWSSTLTSATSTASDISTASATPTAAATAEASGAFDFCLHEISPFSDLGARPHFVPGVLRGPGDLVETIKLRHAVVAVADVRLVSAPPHTTLTQALARAVRAGQIAATTTPEKPMRVLDSAVLKKLLSRALTTEVGAAAVNLAKHSMSDAMETEQRGVEDVDGFTGFSTGFLDTLRFVSDRERDGGGEGGHASAGASNAASLNPLMLPRAPCSCAAVFTFKSPSLTATDKGHDQQQGEGEAQDQGQGKERGEKQKSLANQQRMGERRAEKSDNMESVDKYLKHRLSNHQRSDPKIVGFDDLEPSTLGKIEAGKDAFLCQGELVDLADVNHHIIAESVRGVMDRTSSPFLPLQTSGGQPPAYAKAPKASMPDGCALTSRRLCAFRTPNGLCRSLEIDPSLQGQGRPLFFPVGLYVDQTLVQLLSNVWDEAAGSGASGSGEAEAEGEGERERERLARLPVAVDVDGPALRSRAALQQQDAELLQFLTQTQTQTQRQGSQLRRRMQRDEVDEFDNYAAADDDPYGENE